MLTHSLLNQNNPLLSPLFNGSSIQNNNTNNNLNNNNNNNSVSNNSSINSLNNSMNNANSFNATNGIINTQIPSQNLDAASNIPAASSTINDYTQEELIKHLQEKVNNHNRNLLENILFNL